MGGNYAMTGDSVLSNMDGRLVVGNVLVCKGSGEYKLYKQGTLRSKHCTGGL